ncbi:MAG: NADH-ubiquinone oxidoreductase subunit NDUFA12 family protein, partial [Kiloniellaceae bacterium]
MATIGTRLFTWLWGKEVGRDADGHRYYCHKKGGTTMPCSLQKERRWVVFNGEVEASRVPPEWHGWLHHTTDTIPSADGGQRYPWMREHIPNLTGTERAYRPPGHTLRGG